MTAIGETGRRTTQAGYDVARWRHRLFAEIRTSDAYRRACADVVAGDAAGVDAIATACGLTWLGKPCAWAVRLIDDDIAGRFCPDRAPKVVSRRRARIVEVTASLQGLSAGVYRDRRHVHDPLHRWSLRPDTAMMLTDRDWTDLERDAVDAARAAVRDLRASFQNAGHDHYGPRDVYAAKEAAKAVQIDRLALVLTGRRVPSLGRRTVDRWCAFLRIDRPT